MATVHAITELESEAEDNLPSTPSTGLQTPGYTVTELESAADEDAQPFSASKSGLHSTGNHITELESDADDLEDAQPFPTSGLHMAVTELESDANGRKDADQRRRGKRKREVTFILDSSGSEANGAFEQDGRKRVKTGGEILLAVFGGRCCSSDCLARVTRADAAAARSAFKEKSLCDQRIWLLEYFRTHSSQADEGSFQFSFNIGLEPVCATAWYQVVGIVRSRFYYWQKQFRDGMLYPLPANFQRRGYKTQRTLNAKTQLDQIAHNYGDRMPNQEKLNLPSCFTKREVYERIKNDNAEVCSESHFKRVWRSEGQHITIPKVNRFSKCDECTELKVKLGQTNDKGLRRQLITQHQRHVEKQSSERQKYYKHIQKSKTNPEKYMSVIIDGMDQHCTALPQLHPTPKALNHTSQLNTHITGAIVHGRGQHTYIDFKEYPHDSNLTINIILNILIRYKDSPPPTLYLQLDNTARENKNRHVFAFLSLLVELNIFKKIKVGFLMVGHTHEDVDQFFSRISTHLKKNSITTFPKLLKAIPASFQRSDSMTTAQRITHIFDVRDWLLPHQHSMSYHSKPHIFKFTLDQGKATLQTKDWSTSPHWCNTTGLTHILSLLPDGQPRLVQKSFADINIQLIERGVEKLRPYFQPGDIEAWRSLCGLLTLEEKEREEDDATVRWPICDLLLAGCQRVDALQQEVHADITEDEPFRQVHLGPKVRKERRTDLRKGDMVATYLEAYSLHWPQIGRLDKVTEDSLVLEWFTGTLSSKWKEMKVAVTGQRGRKQLWVETIPRDSVILPPFTLTAGDKLPLQIVNALREKHGDYFE